MKLTDAMLKAVFPLCPAKKRALYLPYINDACLAYGITTELRISAFLATLGAESGELKYMEELASGDAYDTRTDLGNTPQRDGDGRLYKGHGAIQVTGKDNHEEYTDYVREKGHLPFVNFVKEPHRLAELPYCIDSAAWFFAVHIKANPLADRREFLEIQLRVNGGRKRKPPRPNHWAERQAYYQRALRVIEDDFRITEYFPNSLYNPVPEGPAPDAPDDTHPDFLDRMTRADAPEPEEVVTQGAGDSNASSGLQTAGEQPPAGAAPGATASEGSLSPQLVVKERPSLFTRAQTWFLNLIGTIFGSIAAWFGGNEIATRLAEKAANRAVENADRSDLATFGVVMLYVVGIGSVSVFLFWLASKIYDRSANRANTLNVAKIEAAASKVLNTVEFTDNQTKS